MMENARGTVGIAVRMLATCAQACHVHVFCGASHFSLLSYNSSLDYILHFL